MFWDFDLVISLGVYSVHYSVVIVLTSTCIIQLLRKMFLSILLQADIGRHHVNDQQWEVYRFLLLEKKDFSLTDPMNRNAITDRVQEMLIG